MAENRHPDKKQTGIPLPASPTDSDPNAQIETFLALLPPHQRTEAAAILKQNDARSWQILKRKIANTPERMQARVVAVAVIIPALLVVLSMLFTWGLQLPLWSITSAWAIGLGILAMLLVNNRPTALEKAALEIVLSHLEQSRLPEDKQMTGALLEGLRIRGLPAPVVARIKEALVRLLPGLTADDDALLSSTEHTQLCRCLEDVSDHQGTLCLAALAAIRQIGRTESLVVVHAMMERDRTRLSPLVFEEARDCMEQMRLRFDFGPLTKLPLYIETLHTELRREGRNYPLTITCLLALRQLLPRLTPADYHRIQFVTWGTSFYSLLTILSDFSHRYGLCQMQEEVLRTIQRMGDTQALPAIRRIADSVAPYSEAEPVHALAREIAPLLEAQLARETESKTLLRRSSAPAPDALPAELLRAATPAPSETAPTELLRSSTSSDSEAAC